MIICLDAGHYGKYNRSKVVPEYYESEMDWKLVELLAQELEHWGFEVRKTRSEQSKDLGLEARGRKAAGCGLFLSIHSNACGTESVDYPLVVTMQDGKGDKLGLAIAEKIQQLMGTVQKGKISKKRGGNGGEWYGVLRGAGQVGVMGMIVEHSFHTNTKAARWLCDEENLKILAKAEAEILAAWFGQEKADEKDEAYNVYVGSYTQEEAEKVAQILQQQGYHPVVEKICQTVQDWIPEVGDTVFFTGSKQYSNANSDSPVSAAAGEARITAMAEGKKHPYHLQRTGDTGPWGWVDKEDFQKGTA